MTNRFSLVLVAILTLTAQWCWADGAAVEASFEPVEAPSISLQGKKILGQTNARITNINTQQLWAILKEAPETVLIDVRTPAEIALRGGSIDTSNHFTIPRGWLEYRIDSYIIDKKTPIVVYCGTSLRSPLAADTLTKMGYSNIKNYADGFFAWQRAGYPVDSSDKALESFLYDMPQEVIPGVWSAIGDTAPPTYENAGHNNNLSFVITDNGVLVVNAGDNYLLAKALHKEIQKITSQPVKYVVLENGQGHAMLGSSYWQEQGVPVIAHKDTAEAIERDGIEVLERMQLRNRDKAFQTRLVMPDETFESKRVLQMGSTRVEILYLGPAHGHGDVLVWLPNQKLVITGDMAFHERLLPVFEETDTDAWLETWEKFAALNAIHVIPGHGKPTDMAEVTKYTKDYLIHMRKEIGSVLEQGGSLEDAYTIDQSNFVHLDTFFELSRSNAGQIFREMEFE